MLYLTGDMHGILNIHKLSATNWPEQTLLSKNDYLVILGDFGLIWNPKETKEERYWLDWLDEKPFTTLFLDGNHENFDRLYKFPEVDMFGDKVGKISESVFHLKRGRVYNINNKKFFTFGGGLSIDKNNRIPYISWWPEEYPSYEEINLGWINLQKNEYKVNYVLTHVAPESIFNEFSNNEKFLKKSLFSNKIEDYVSKILEEYKKTIIFDKWFFGHYHFDDKINNKFEVMFQNILYLEY